MRQNKTARKVSQSNFFQRVYDIVPRLSNSVRVKKKNCLWPNDSIGVKKNPHILNNSVRV